LALNQVYSKFHQHLHSAGKISTHCSLIDCHPTKLTIVKVTGLEVHRISIHSKVLMICQAL